MDQSSLVEQCPQALIPVGNDANVQTARTGLVQRVVDVRVNTPCASVGKDFVKFLEAGLVLPS